MKEWKAIFFVYHPKRGIFKNWRPYVETESFWMQRKSDYCEVVIVQFRKTIFFSKLSLIKFWSAIQIRGTDKVQIPRWRERQKRDEFPEKKYSYSRGGQTVPFLLLLGHSNTSLKKNNCISFWKLRAAFIKAVVVEAPPNPTLIKGIRNISGDNLWRHNFPNTQFNQCYDFRS